MTLVFEENMKWNSINYSLPPKRDKLSNDVLILVAPCKIEIGYLDYCSDLWHLSDNKVIDFKKVLYWMPLPKLPGEKNDNYKQT